MILRNSPSQTEIVRASFPKDIRSVKPLPKYFAHYPKREPIKDVIKGGYYPYLASGFSFTALVGFGAHQHGTTPGYLANGDIDLANPPTDLTSSGALSYASQAAFEAAYPSKKIDFTEIDGASNEAIKLVSITDATIANCIIRDSGRVSIWLEMCSGVTIRNCYFHGSNVNGDANNGHAILVYHCKDNIVIAGNRIYDCGGGIQFYDDRTAAQASTDTSGAWTSGYNTQKTNCRVLNNHIKNCVEKGSSSLRASLLMWHTYGTTMRVNDNISIQKAPSVTGTDISFTNPSTISGTGFDDLLLNAPLVVTGTSSNNGTYTVTARSSTSLTISGGTLTNESAGGSFTLTSTPSQEDHFNIGADAGGVTADHLQANGNRAYGGDARNGGGMVLLDGWNAVTASPPRGSFIDSDDFIGVLCGGYGGGFAGGSNSTVTNWQLFSDETNLVGNVGFLVQRFQQPQGEMYGHTTGTSGNTLDIQWKRVDSYTNVSFTGNNQMQRDSGNFITGYYGVGTTVQVITDSGLNDGTYTVNSRPNAYTVVFDQTTITTETAAAAGTTSLAWKQHTYYPSQGSSSGKDAYDNAGNYLGSTGVTTPNHGQCTRATSPYCDTPNEVAPTGWSSYVTSNASIDATIWLAAWDEWSSTYNYVAAGDL